MGTATSIGAKSELATIVPISTIGMQVSHLAREINVAFAVQGVWVPSGMVGTECMGAQA